MKRKPNVALTMPSSLRKRLFDRENTQALRAVAGKVVAHTKDGKAQLKDLARLLKDAEVVISSWGSPCITAEALAVAPKLRLICHAAGTVKGVVSDAVWKRGIRVTSAASAIAVAVAETALGCMITGMKDIFRIRGKLQKGLAWWEARQGSREMYRKTIGIIGASHVGRYVIRLLDGFDVTILLYDPYVSAAKANKLGVTKVTLPRLLRESDIVSLHAPSTDETRHMLGAKAFRMMKDDALFINTARGAIIDEKALIRELKKGRFFAFLDVTDPEPPKKGHPFYRLDNVVLTPHIAGTVDDVTPLGKLAIEEVERFSQGKKPLYPVTRRMLSHIG